MAGFDKIGRDTGQGRFEADLTPLGTSVVSRYLLFNYNIDGNVLKPEHKQDLDKHVVPLLKQHQLYAKLTGMASQSGDREYNRQLSAGRVLRVKEYLLRQGIPEAKLPVPDVQAAGEDLSTSKNQEDERDRGVRITIALGVKALPLWPTIVIPIVITPDEPWPLDIPPVAPLPRPSRRSMPWTIRQLHGVNVGFGASVGVPFVGAGIQAGMVEYHYLLVNRRTQQMAQCRYFGPAASGGVGPGGLKPGLGPSAGMSMTMASRKWNDFETRPDADFSDFKGEAKWSEPAGAGMGTDVALPAQLDLLELGITVQVETGRTIGFPGAVMSVGNFRCKKPVQLKL